MATHAKHGKQLHQIRLSVRLPELNNKGRPPRVCVCSLLVLSTNHPVTKTNILVKENHIDSCTNRFGGQPAEGLLSTRRQTNAHGIREQEHLGKLAS